LQVCKLGLGFIFIDPEPKGFRLAENMTLPKKYAFFLPENRRNAILVHSTRAQYVANKADASAHF